MNSRKILNLIGILKNFKPAFGPVSDAAEDRQKLGKKISPIYFVTSNLPLTFITQDDADRLVPTQQVESSVKRAREAGARATLVAKAGKGHGWTGWVADIYLLTNWLEEYLRGIKPQP